MAATVIALVFALAACSSGAKKSGGTSNGKPSACDLISQLDQTAALVAHADVSDPDAFAKMLNAAVAKYVATVERLKQVTPSTLQVDLDRIIAAVHQERFDDAATARASLDEYALTTCGRSLPTLSSPPTSATTTVPSFGSTTTGPRP
jgi:hypothetical protein